MFQVEWNAKAIWGRTWTCVAGGWEGRISSQLCLVDRFFLHCKTHGRGRKVRKLMKQTQTPKPNVKQWNLIAFLKHENHSKVSGRERETDSTLNRRFSGVFRYWLSKHEQTLEKKLKSTLCEIILSERELLGRPDRCKVSGEPSLMRPAGESKISEAGNNGSSRSALAPCIGLYFTHHNRLALTYPTCRCSQRKIPTGSCYLWIASAHPRSRLAATARAAVGTRHDDSADTVAYASSAALHNSRRYRCRCHSTSSSDYFENDRESLLRDHRKLLRVDQIPSDLCNMTGSTWLLCLQLLFTIIAHRFLHNTTNGTYEFSDEFCFSGGFSLECSCLYPIAVMITSDEW